MEKFSATKICLGLKGAPSMKFSKKMKDFFPQKRGIISLKEKKLIFQPSMFSEICEFSRDIREFSGFLFH